MRLTRFAIALWALGFGVSLFAQPVKSDITASNGVVISVSKDEFASRSEYTSPIVPLSVNDGKGFVLIGAIRKGGQVTSRGVTGTIAYIGTARRFNAAIFRGGEPVDFLAGKRDVDSCYRRNRCLFTESFVLTISEEQINKYSSNGTLAIQLRAESTETVMVSIPTSYFAAVDELLLRPE